MAFFGGFVNKIVKKFNDIVHGKSAPEPPAPPAPPPLPPQPQPQSVPSGSLVNFQINYDPNQAIFTGSALISVLFSRSSPDLLEYTGDAGLAIIQGTLEPLRRTGDIADSFQYRINPTNNSVEIYSDHKGAYGIQFGIYDPAIPPVGALLEWMNHKEDFSGLDEDDRVRVAFAINRHIAAGKQPGDRSDIKTLTPQGLRRFDYVSEVAEQLDQEIRYALDTFFQRI